MYPFRPGQFAPRNAWYVAAFSRDVGRFILARTVLATPLVIYRKADGAAVVMDGRCPHRHFPLGKSALEGDNVRCGYHGFVFGPDGRCLEIPSQSHVPRACRVPVYPAIEHGLWLWVWLGDPAGADPGLLPSLAQIGLEGEGLEAHPLIFREVACRYQLLNDNLFDLSHLAFLHGNTIGTLENASTPEELEKRPGFVSSVRRIRDAPVPPTVWQRGTDGLERIDRAMGMQSYLPCFHAGFTEVRVPASHPARGGEVLSWSRVYHAITPVTPQASLYHFAVAGAPGLDAPAMKAALDPVIDEDVFASEQIEAIIALYGGNPPPELMVKSDANAVEGRRMIEAMMDAEGQGS